MSSALPTIPASSSDDSDTNASSAQQTSAAASASGSSPSASASNSASATATAPGSSAATNLPSIGGSSTEASTQTSSSSISVITGAPSLSTGQGSGPLLSLTGLPTLSGAYSYPPASVPPTANAPFMKQSHLPQNFVFIVVGGVLALVLVVVVLWRSLTAWSINRSFKKDASAAYTPLPDYKKKPNFNKSESVLDMADLSGAGPKLPKSFNSVPNLFFSPTAEAARQSMIRPQSQHMPSGHYRDGSKS